MLSEIILYIHTYFPIQIPEELDSMSIIRKMCNSINNPSPKKRRMWKLRQQQHMESKAIARAYKLGKGRLKTANGGEHKGAL